MSKDEAIIIELYYTLTCPNCKVMERLLNDVLPQYGNRFKLKKTLANGPVGYFKTLKLGIYAVPTLLIEDKIVFKSVPSKLELTDKLNQIVNH